jgi:hypothetical protein
LSNSSHHRKRWFRNCNSLRISGRTLDVVLSEQSHIHLRCLEDYGGLSVCPSVCLSSIFLLQFILLFYCYFIFLYFSLLVQVFSIRAKQPLSTLSGKLWRFVGLSVSLSFCLFVFPSICLFVFLLLFLSFCYSVFLSSCLSSFSSFSFFLSGLSMLFYPSKAISIYAVWKSMEVCLSICLFVFLSLCLTVTLPLGLFVF